MSQLGSGVDSLRNARWRIRVTRTERVENDGEQAENEHPRDASVRGTIELVLRAASEIVAGLRECPANRRNRHGFVVGEELVALIELFEAYARMREQRHGDAAAPFALQVRVISEELSRSGELPLLQGRVDRAFLRIVAGGRRAVLAPVKRVPR
jgi:hypothetical protein